MRIGLIARADSRGLGIQTKSFHDEMRPAKTMVIDCPSQKPLPVRRDWYPDATWIHGLPRAMDFRSWLPGLDVVYTAETGYARCLWDIAREMRVRTVLHANYEFLDRRDEPSRWAAPSQWHIGEFPHGTVHLPVPIRVAAPVDFHGAGSATRFLHVVGRPAVHDRNGTLDLLRALPHVTAEVTVTVRCQEPGYVSGLIREHRIHTPGNVTLVVDVGDVPDNTDLYVEQDVLVMPRRFGGLCLPANEALGAGMPVIMPDISPNNTWLPPEWLVPATWRLEFNAKTRVAVYETQQHALAAKIDQMATDTGFYTKAALRAREIADSLSWDALRPAYLAALA